MWYAGFSVCVCVYGYCVYCWYSVVKETNKKGDYGMFVSIHLCVCFSFASFSPSACTENRNNNTCSPNIQNTETNKQIHQHTQKRYTQPLTHTHIQSTHTHTHMHTHAHTYTHLLLSRQSRQMTLHTDPRSRYSMVSVTAAWLAVLWMAVPCVFWGLLERNFFCWVHNCFGFFFAFKWHDFQRIPFETAGGVSVVMLLLCRKKNSWLILYFIWV